MLIWINAFHRQHSIVTVQPMSRRHVGFALPRVQSSAKSHGGSRRKRTHSIARSEWEKLDGETGNVEQERRNSFAHLPGANGREGQGHVKGNESAQPAMSRIRSSSVVEETRNAVALLNNLITHNRNHSDFLRPYR